MLASSSSVPASMIILLLSLLNQCHAFQPSIQSLVQLHGGYDLRKRSHLQRTTTSHSRRNNSVVSYRSNVQLNLSSSDYNQFQSLQRKGITLPLMDLASSPSSSDTIITPLPACHLPTELSSFHIYGMQLQVAIHKMMIEETLSKLQVGNRSGEPSAAMIGLQEDIFGRDTTSEPLYGHLISARKENEGNGDESDSDSDSSKLVGAIGCAAEIIIATPSDTVQMETVMEDPSLSSSFSSLPTSTDGNNDPSKQNQDSIITVLTKGSFRFIVREVVQTFPYPIVVVDELLDDPISNNDDDYVKEEENATDSSSSSAAALQKEKIYNDFADEYEEDEDFDDEEEDIYSNLTPTDLMQRTFSAMKAIVDQKLDVKSKPISPLEQSILEEKGLSSDTASSMESLKRDQAEEMAATLDVFISSLIDIAPSKTERFYVVAMMAAEFGGLDNGLRREILVTTNGVERLRKVVKALEKKISFVQAKKLTQGIVDKSDDASKELKVGKPTIPEWAKRLSKGMKIEYYWSEQDGWLVGTIVEAVMIVDELIVTVLFDDGETVRLPFDPEEKVRWRPAGM